MHTAISKVEELSDQLAARSEPLEALPSGLTLLLLLCILAQAGSPHFPLRCIGNCEIGPKP